MSVQVAGAGCIRFRSPTNASTRVADNRNTHRHHEACRVVAEAGDIACDPKNHRNGKLGRAFLTSPDKRVVFHFTPRYASWLNQIERWHPGANPAA